MPLYLDIHDLQGATSEDVAKAHSADVEAQQKYGVNYRKYWFNESASVRSQAGGAAAHLPAASWMIDQTRRRCASVVRRLPRPTRITARPRSFVCIR